MQNLVEGWLGFPPDQFAALNSKAQCFCIPSLKKSLAGKLPWAPFEAAFSWLL
jgi:hypothetical protein